MKFSDFTERIREFRKQSTSFSDSENMCDIIDISDSQLIDMMDVFDEQFNADISNSTLEGATDEMDRNAVSEGSDFVHFMYLFPPLVNTILEYR